MTKYLYPDLRQLGKFSGGELQVAFALHNIIKLTRDPHISKFQIQSPNSKKRIYFTLSLKKNTHTHTHTQNISYIHPIERVDEVGETKTSNDYRGLVEWGRGGQKLVVSTQCVDHDPYFGEGGSAKLVLYEAATADSPP